MQPLTLQPTFEIEVDVPRDEFMRRMRQALGNGEFQDRIITAGNCIDLLVDANDQRFWSPHLSVQVSSLDSDQRGQQTTLYGSKLYCRFSPRPEIWTMFMAVYAVIFGLIFLAAICGYVQWALGNTPWLILTIPIGVGLIAALHVGSKLGQRLSSDQMHHLKQRLTSAIDAASATNSSLSETLMRLDRVAKAKRR